VLVDDWGGGRARRLFGRAARQERNSKYTARLVSRTPEMRPARSSSIWAHPLPAPGGTAKRPEQGGDGWGRGAEDPRKVPSVSRGALAAKGYCSDATRHGSPQPNAEPRMVLSFYEVEGVGRAYPERYSRPRSRRHAPTGSETRFAPYSADLSFRRHRTMNRGDFVPLWPKGLTPPRALPGDGRRRTRPRAPRRLPKQGFAPARTALEWRMLREGAPFMGRRMAMLKRLITTTDRARAARG